MDSKDEQAIKVFADELARELGNDWRVSNVDTEYRGRATLKQSDGLALSITTEWNAPDKWCITATGWPEYTDSEGSTHSICPSQLSVAERRSAPETRAAKSRAANQIARQVERRLMPAYTRLRAECAKVAEQYQQHGDERREAEELLLNSVEGIERANYRSGLYCRLRGVYELNVSSASSVTLRMNVSAEEAKTILAYIAAERKGQEAA